MNRWPLRRSTHTPTERLDMREKNEFLTAEDGHEQKKSFWAEESCRRGPGLVEAVVWLWVAGSICDDLVILHFSILVSATIWSFYILVF